MYTVTTQILIWILYYIVVYEPNFILSEKLLHIYPFVIQYTTRFVTLFFSLSFFDVDCCRPFFSCFCHKNYFGYFILFFTIFFLLILVQNFQAQVQPTSGFLYTKSSEILAKTTTGKQKFLTLTENHDVILRLDKGDPGSLSNFYIMLTFTDVILHRIIAKVNVLRYVMRTLFFLIYFLSFFAVFSCK